MHLRGCAARYDGRPLEHVKFLNEIGKDVRPVAFFGRRPPTSRFPMSTSVSSISGPLRSLARSSHEGHHARPFPCCVFFRPLSLKEGDARCGFVVFGFGLAPVARSPLTEDVRAARGTPAPASRTLAETSGRVGSLGGGSSMRIISRRKRKKNVTALRVRLSPRRRGVKGRKRSRSIGCGDGGDEQRSAAQALFCCCEGRRGRSSVNKRSVFVPHRMEEDAATGPSSDLIPCPHPNLQFSVGVPLATHRQHEDEDEDEEEHSMSSARRSLTKLGNGATCVWVRPSLRAPGDRTAIERPDRHGRSPSRPSRDGLARFASPQPAGITGRWGLVLNRSISQVLCVVNPLVRRGTGSCDGFSHSHSKRASLRSLNSGKDR